VTITEPVIIWVPTKMLDPVEAYVVEFLLSNKSEFNAYDAESTLLAQLLVPNNDPLCIPINEPVNEPVLIWEELDMVPTGAGAYDADIALDTIPKNDPENDPVDWFVALTNARTRIFDSDGGAVKNVTILLDNV
jgi:hypothetical protein